MTEQTDPTLGGQNEGANADQSNPPVGREETTIYVSHPVMFRAHPIWFLICVGLTLAVGIGLVPLIIWWIWTKASTLTVTDKRTTERRGLIAKHTTEVLHAHIRNIQVHQGMIDRIFGVGAVGISSSGQAGIEVMFKDVKDPEALRRLIDQQRNL